MRRSPTAGHVEKLRHVPGPVASAAVGRAGKAFVALDQAYGFRAMHRMRIQREPLATAGSQGWPEDSAVMN